MGVVDDIRRVAATLDAERIPFMLVGGFALDALGVPRATVDVDLQVAMDPPPRAASTVLGLIIEERSRDSVFDQDVIIGHVPTSGVPIELFITSHWFTRQALERRQTVKSGMLGQEIPIPRVEDFILLKSAYMTSPARSTRKAAQDGVDVETLMQRTAGTLDAAYVEAAARQLGTWDALRPLLTGIRER
jgi:hypothetical protein